MISARVGVAVSVAGERSGIGGRRSAEGIFIDDQPRTRRVSVLRMPAKRITEAESTRLAPAAC
jgi:hypothetical protein